jgi:hypothetical protein
MREFLFQIILALFGAVIGVVATILREGLLKKIAIIITGIIIIVLIFWGGFEVGQRANTAVAVSLPPHVSLISISYEIDKFNPRTIDLRTSYSSGIPVEAKQSLIFFDIWFSATENDPSSSVQAEIYFNDTLLGSTSPKPLIAGQFKLDGVKIKNYSNGDGSAWIVQPGWDNLNVFLITYRDGKIADRNLNVIHLARDGSSGFVYPPNLSFVSVVYTINNGPEVILDFRFAESNGITAKPGDLLTLHEIWYDSNASCSGCKVHAEAIFADQQYSFDKSTYKETGRTINEIKPAINPIKVESISWTLTGRTRVLVLSLVRDDEPILDTLRLPISQ